MLARWGHHQASHAPAAWREMDGLHEAVRNSVAIVTTSRVTSCSTYLPVDDAPRTGPWNSSPATANGCRSIRVAVAPAGGCSKMARTAEVALVSTGIVPNWASAESRGCHRLRQSADAHSLRPLESCTPRLSYGKDCSRLGPHSAMEARAGLPTTSMTVPGKALFKGNQ